MRLVLRTALACLLAATRFSGAVSAQAGAVQPANNIGPGIKIEPTPPGGKGKEYSLLIEVGRSGKASNEPPRAFPTRILSQMTDFKPQPIALDKWGGRTDRTAPTTGFFYTKQIDSRWWCVDPDGHLYFNQAMDAVNATSTPAARASLTALFGSKDKWIASTHDLLLQDGFHATGAWSDVESIRHASFQSATPLAYTVILDVMSNYGHQRGGMHSETGHAGYLGDVIFVFDPGFAAYLDKYLKDVLPQYAQDPAVFGYFSDNEMPINRDNLDEYLALPHNEPGYTAAQQWMTDHHASSPNDDLRKQFLAFEIDRYGSLVSAAIHKYDPNHMYLGSRFCCKTVNTTEAYAAMGKYADAISVNYYGAWTPDFGKLAEWAGAAHKPIIITEWYAKGMDSGMPNKTGAGFRVATQAQRGAFYQNFVLGLIQSKNVIGWQWFKYQDNDPNDPHAEASNIDSNKGIVDGHFKPYQPLLDSMKLINTNSYALADYFDKRGN